MSLNTLKTDNKILYTIIFTMFLNMVSFGILIPILPLLFTDTTSPYYILQNSIFHDYKYLILGLLLGIYPLAIFFFGPILGELSDAIGRKKVLLICVLGSFISHTILAIGVLTGSLPLIFLSRFVDGVTGANVSTLQSALGDISNDENRARNFGLMGATFGTGFIIGPFLGGVLSDNSIHSFLTPSTPLFFNALLSFINIVFIYFFFKETNTHTDNRKVHLHPKRSVEHIKEGLKDKKMGVIFETSFLQSLGFAFFTTMFGAYLINKFSFTQISIGNFFALVGVCNILVQIFIVRPIGKKYSETKILKYSIFLSSIMMLLYSIAPSSIYLYLITPLFSVSMGLINVNIGMYLNKHTEPKSRGKINGILSSVQSLAQGIAPLLAGVISQAFLPHASIKIAAVFIFFSGVLFTRKTKNTGN